MKKKIKFHKIFPALWSRASESGHLVQIFGSVSVIWGFFQHIQVINLPENLGENKAEEEN
jgi:hypothetical protein